MVNPSLDPTWPDGSELPTFSYGCQGINPVNQRDAYLQHWSGSSLTQVMARCLFGAKPLPALQWRHNGRDGVSNHRRLGCLPSHLFRRTSKKTSKLRVTSRCEGNSPVTSEFPAQIASNAENVSIWGRHHVNQFRFIFNCTLRNKLQWSFKSDLYISYEKSGFRNDMQNCGHLVSAAVC